MTACCTMCLKAIAAKGSRHTNLLLHRQKKHPIEWDNLCALLNEQNCSSPSTATKKQPAVVETFSNCTQYEKKGVQWNTITDTAKCKRYGSGRQACLPCQKISSEEQDVSFCVGKKKCGYFYKHYNWFT